MPNIKLADVEKVTAVVSPATSGATAAVYPLADEFGVPTVGASATADGITQDANGNVYKNAFRVCFLDSYQGVAMAKFALNNLNANTYDELNINTDINNYPFNTILIYYSIYDNNDNLLSTNLYGVYFIDSVVQIGEANNNDNFINFGIPRLTKKKSTIEGFGTSYSFRFNIRTSSLFEGENDIIYDNASSENSIVNDFNDVVADLNTTLNLLNKYTKYTFILQERYNTLNKKYEDLNKNINSLTQIVNELKNKKG